MAGERARVISFAEYYFGLVDGIFPGLESSLAENVVLHWFGKTVRGRKRVSAFIRRDAVSSLHLFTSIEPTSGIVCEEAQRQRFVRDIEIIQRDVDRMKLKDKTRKTAPAVESGRERSRADELARAGEIECVKADGKVTFVKKEVQEDPWSYHWSSQRKRRWQRECTLQIAYSRNGEGPSGIPEDPSNEDSSAAVRKRRDAPARLLDLEEAIAANVLVPDVNHFGGYLKPLNFAEDREKFLRDFEAEVARKNPDARLSVARYVGNKLIVERKEDPREGSSARRRALGANWRIHAIVYQRSRASAGAARTE